MANNMSNEEQRARWDRKYEQGITSLTKPDPFFISAYERFVDQSFPNAGVALDLAGGIGRHALWLASRNWQVSVVDLSVVAIERLRQTALRLNVKLDLFAMAAADYKLERTRFDLIVLFYHTDRNLFPKIVSALKPGGLLICKAHVRWDSVRSAFLRIDQLDRNELVSLVQGLEVMYHEERPSRDRGVVEFVGRRTLGHLQQAETAL